MRLTRKLTKAQDFALRWANVQGGWFTEWPLPLRHQTVRRLEALGLVQMRRGKMRWTGNAMTAWHSFRITSAGKHWLKVRAVAAFNKKWGF